MLRLRRRWTPPRSWPRPPRGFVPPPGWRPDPAWPATPEGWNFWRIPRGRLLAAMLFVGLAIAFWTGVRSDLRAWHQHSALDSRGVTTLASVLGYSYDPDGGDPNGWTTDHVRFTTAAGTVVTIVGHHGPGPERSTRTLPVTYDPEHPALARAARYVDDADDPANAVASGVVALLVTALAGFLVTRLVSLR